MYRYPTIPPTIAKAMLAKNERNKILTNAIGLPSHGSVQPEVIARATIAVNANAAKLVPMKTRKQTQIPNMNGFRKIISPARRPRPCFSDLLEHSYIGGLVSRNSEKTTRSKNLSPGVVNKLDSPLALRQGDHELGSIVNNVTFEFIL